jgi:Mn-dependent DtxR family transcriptional regulator
MGGGTYKLSPREFDVLNFVNDYQREYCETPSYHGIAKKFKFRESTARQYIRKLEKKGIISINDCDDYEFYILKNAFAIFEEDEID